MLRRHLLCLGALCLAPVCLPAGSLTVTLAGAKGESVADAVVSLVPLDRPVPAPVPAEPVEVAQEDQEYVPYVTAVRTGTQVDFPNKDKIQHHLYSVSKPKRFEKPLYAAGAHESVVFDRPGVITLGCNIHDWMIAYVVVLDTPYFAKSDRDGRATVAGIEPGRYRLEVWHPRLGKSVEQEVLVPAPAPLSVTLVLKPDRRIRRAPDGKTGGY